ncbi:helix-turn-helix domain-containing protein [Pseudomonas sp. C1C7]|nr:helix-turn-helix domain-containing protein [Pseudomonas sp. C1C7]
MTHAPCLILLAWGVFLAGFCPKQIKALLEKNNLSQMAFARYLNTSPSTVKQWEAGDEHPSGMALKLLSIVQKHGLEILA